MLSEILQSKLAFLQAACTSGGHEADAWALSRVWLKIALLGGRTAWPGLAPGASGMVVLSQCEECESLAARVASIEEKLDRLLAIQMGTDGRPAWAEQSEQRVIAAVKNITAEVGALAVTDAELRTEADRLRIELGDLAAGADRFLAGLQSKLSERDTILFFELIASVDAPDGRRVKTYEEIGPARLSRNGRGQAPELLEYGGSTTLKRGGKRRRAVYAFTETHYLSNTTVDDDYKTAMFQLTGKVNILAFRGFEVGEVLFLGATGAKRGSEDWEITFRFAASRNRTGITSGTITGIAKKGWEYLWVRYADEEDTLSHTLVNGGAHAHREFRICLAKG